MRSSKTTAAFGNRKQTCSPSAASLFCSLCPFCRHSVPQDLLASLSLQAKLLSSIFHHHTYLPFPSLFPCILRCFCTELPDQPVPFYFPSSHQDAANGSASLTVPESCPFLIPPLHCRSGCCTLTLALERAHILLSCRGSLSRIPPYGTTSLHFIAWKISR